MNANKLKKLYPFDNEILDREKLLKYFIYIDVEMNCLIDDVKEDMLKTMIHNLRTYLGDFDKAHLKTLTEVGNTYHKKVIYVNKLIKDLNEIKYKKKYELTGELSHETFYNSFGKELNEIVPNEELKNILESNNRSVELIIIMHKYYCKLLDKIYKM